MIRLAARGHATGIPEEILAKVSTLPLAVTAARRHVVRVFDGDHRDEPLDGYAAVVTSAEVPPPLPTTPVVSACATGHLRDGDVVSISPRGDVRTVYRRLSRTNTLFATDRCNSLCLMCSQPPREVDDSGQTTRLLRLIELIDPSTQDLGITGGEPTLLGEGLLDVVASCRDRLPTTSLHLLSNGRLFRERRYAEALGAIKHPDLVVGVPLYSDTDSEHDYVVQALGAFDETVRGLHNLAQAGVLVEIRIVVHAKTYRRLPRLADYIYRNLTFASHVAFMGLEVIGFGRTNIASLWIDPVDYADELEHAVSTLSIAGMNVSIYNHQLCTVPPSLWPYCRRSISDWKNDYAPECESCGVRSDCGGFFTWNLHGHKSRAIAAIPVASESRGFGPLQPEVSR